MYAIQNIEKLIMQHRVSLNSNISFMEGTHSTFCQFSHFVKYLTASKDVHESLSKDVYFKVKAIFNCQASPFHSKPQQNFVLEGFRTITTSRSFK